MSRWKLAQNTRWAVSIHNLCKYIALLHSKKKFRTIENMRKGQVNLWIPAPFLLCVSLRNEEKVERFFKWLLHIFLLFPENWTHLFMMPQSWNIWWRKMKNVNCSQLELGLPWQGMELPFPEILNTSTTSTEKSWTTVKMVNDKKFRQMNELFHSKCCQINLGYLND